MADLREYLPHNVTSIAVESILSPSDGEGIGVLVLTTDEGTFRFAMPGQGAYFMIDAMDELLDVLKRHARKFEGAGDGRITQSRLPYMQ
jgi:hypothetical protein